MTPTKGILVNLGSLFPVLTYFQLRNHFRLDGLAGPNRLVPEDDLRSFRPIDQQRMPDKRARASCEGELGYLQVYHQHVESNAQA